MKKVIIITITIISALVLLLFVGCWTDAANAIAPDEAMMIEDLEMADAQEAEEQDIENEGGEKVEKDPEENGSGIANQSGTLIFDNNNSELGCFVQANMTIEDKDNKDLKSTMVLTTGTSQMGKNPTIFDITFDFTQGTITGGFNGIYYRPEKEDGTYDSSDITANISNGTVIWDVDQKVWFFEGDVKMEVNLEMKNKIGSSGNEILYGDANIDTNVTGKITGASGKHNRLDHHGENQSSGAFFNIFYEGDFPQATGNGELRFLSIECWLEMPLGEDMVSKFPPGP